MTGVIDSGSDSDFDRGRFQGAGEIGLGGWWWRGTYDGRMRVTVNNEVREVGVGTTVADLLRALELEGKPCAAEVNRKLVPKREHGSRVLLEGDVVELVTLVGGG